MELFFHDQTITSSLKNHLHRLPKLSKSGVEIMKQDHIEKQEEAIATNSNQAISMNTVVYIYVFSFEIMPFLLNSNFEFSFESLFLWCMDVPSSTASWLINALFCIKYMDSTSASSSIWSLEPGNSRNGVRTHLDGPFTLFFSLLGYLIR